MTVPERYAALDVVPRREGINDAVRECGIEPEMSALSTNEATTVSTDKRSDTLARDPSAFARFEAPSPCPICMECWIAVSTTYLPGAVYLCDQCADQASLDVQSASILATCRMAEGQESFLTT